MQLDQTDRKILNILQQDARLELRQIASLIHKTVSPTYERIQKLHRLGYIQRYIAVLNREKIGWPILAIIRVSLTRHKQETFTAFELGMANLEEVLQCLHISGDCDFVLHVVFPDMAAYHHFLVSKLCILPNVNHTATSFVLKELKAPGPYIL